MTTLMETQKNAWLNSISNKLSNKVLLAYVFKKFSQQFKFINFI